MVNPLILIKYASHTHANFCPSIPTTSFQAKLGYFFHALGCKKKFYYEADNSKEALLYDDTKILHLPGSFSDGFKTKVLPHVTATGNICGKEIR